MTLSYKRQEEKPPFLDFFAGSGLVCEALKSYFTPVWANDICDKKAAVFCANHPKEVFRLGPIQEVNGKDLPSAVLSWGSFPCQDLSLAGNQKGISSSRSGLVWHWLRVMDEMAILPPVCVAENVVGLVSSRKGDNYRKLHDALVERGYKVGALILDAAHWLPQSRKRVFVVAVYKTVDSSDMEGIGPVWCHPASVRRAAKGLDEWVWWRIPEPNAERSRLEHIIETNAPCDDDVKRRNKLDLIPARHRLMLEAAASKGKIVFPGYKRIRGGRQVLELRFDGLAGCLRTPEGGSSRQILVIRDNGGFHTRLLTVRETAALMGVPASYKIPGTYNDGYRAMGDAVAVPVARYLAEKLLHPLVQRLPTGTKEILYRRLMIN
ncbi:MAG: DNA cytosine methyltransferase [Deltaproteobacteria bacterium]|nr:DNA cytosine methyltransferase [Deltaproteobacteria bacterium]